MFFFLDLFLKSVAGYETDAILMRIRRWTEEVSDDRGRCLDRGTLLLSVYNETMFNMCLPLLF